jgi:hypothetical protein
VGGNLAQHGELGFRQDQAVQSAVVSRRWARLSSPPRLSCGNLPTSRAAWRSGEDVLAPGDFSAGKKVPAGLRNVLHGPAAEAEMAGGPVEFRPGVQAPLGPRASIQS